ncbi:methyltransferase domain-containing protein [Planococcaceae bacterium Storch 2/2-2]|nr:methyltransferase domain-containing protein [Planococcaceae bacterium Storch 2/2-2]
MFSTYGPLSTLVYDMTKPVGHSIDGDIEYYKERLKTCQGRILEAGVGSGRVLIPLLEAGHTVDGVDASPDMLASCRARCAARGWTPHLYEGDVTKLALPERYEAIILPTGSFCLIEDRTEASRALRHFYDHLILGGRLIVDVPLPYDWKEGDSSITSFPLADGEGVTMKYEAVEIDWLRQVTVSHLTYEKWQHGTLVETELQRFAMRWYGVEEFRSLLREIGFSSVTCSANYTYGKEPTDARDMITFEAVR